MKPTILKIFPLWDLEAERKLSQFADVIEANTTDEDEIIKLAQQADAVIVRNPAKLTAKIIQSCTHLKAISSVGVGVDHIDVAQATKYRIPVLHAPNFNAVATAEHTVALLLASCKSLVQYHQETKQGNYESRNNTLGVELFGKKVAIIGFGAISQHVARMLSLGFNMNVFVWVRKMDATKKEIAKQLNITLSTKLDDVFKDASVVSIHVPLVEETRGFVNQHLLSMMKQHSYLINTARGGVLDTQAVLEALNSNRLSGAAIDVFHPEPPLRNDPLLGHKKVIATPHVGGLTLESNKTTSLAIVENICSLLGGNVPKYIVNPATLNE